MSRNSRLRMRSPASPTPAGPPRGRVEHVVCSSLRNAERASTETSASPAALGLDAASTPRRARGGPSAPDDGGDQGGDPNEGQDGFMWARWLLPAGRVPTVTDLALIAPAPRSLIGVAPRSNASRSLRSR